MGQTVTTDYVIQQKIEHSIDRMGGSALEAKGPDCGNFGSVRRAIDARTQQPRAIKHIEKRVPEIKEKTLLEIKIMTAVSGQHPYIVEFFEYFQEWNHFDLVFEFCGNGTLSDAISSKAINHTSAAAFCFQLLSALVFLKQRVGVLHRDVKPANILLKDEFTCKLADFGSACFLGQNETLGHRGGTPAFWPPEVDILPGGEGYAYPYDVWAVGCTLYMMLFGEHPFIHKGNIDTRNLRVGGFDAGMMWVSNPKCYQLLRWLLMPCPRQRVQPENAQNHAWLYSHGFGTGSFADATPPKLVPDSYGRWGEDHGY